MNKHKHHTSEKENGSPTPENQSDNTPDSGNAAKTSDVHAGMTHGKEGQMKSGESNSMNHAGPGAMKSGKPALGQQAGNEDNSAMENMSAEEHAAMMKGESGGEHANMRHGAAAESGGHDSMTHAMSETGHGSMMWRESLWASFVNLLLGAWLVTSPFSLGYQSAALVWSDIISGSLIILFSLLSAYKGFLGNLARWANCFVGIWLLFAPLVFWSPDAAAYANDTLVGALVIAFAILVTMMPGMDMSVMDGADVPPGWSYNPSSWLQRAPIILLAAVGFFASRYMAAYQLGHINEVWDPFFGDGTRRVLTSDVSKMFPISDAGFGAVSYTLEILMGFMGDKARWRTMPWMVTFFGILVVPLGVTSVVLIVLQPLAVGAWCSLCLLAAIAMLIMVPATIDEVVAMLQFMAQARREGKPLWRTFWLGGTVEGKQDARLTPFDWSRPFEMFQTWVMSNWNLLLSVALAVWLLLAPAFFLTTGRAADSDRLLGVLIITFAAVAIAETARAVRFINILFGAWLVISPLLLGGYTPAALVNGIVVGFALIILSFPIGKIRGRYGSWNYYIR